MPNREPINMIPFDDDIVFTVSSLVKEGDDILNLTTNTFVESKEEERLWYNDPPTIIERWNKEYKVFLYLIHEKSYGKHVFLLHALSVESIDTKIIMDNNLTRAWDYLKEGYGASIAQYSSETFELPFIVASAEASLFQEDPNLYLNRTNKYGVTGWQALEGYGLFGEYKKTHGEA